MAARRISTSLLTLCFITCHVMGNASLLPTTTSLSSTTVLASLYVGLPSRSLGTSNGSFITGSSNVFTAPLSVSIISSRCCFDLQSKSLETSNDISNAVLQSVSLTGSTIMPVSAVSSHVALQQSQSLRMSNSSFTSTLPNVWTTHSTSLTVTASFSHFGFQQSLETLISSSTTVLSKVSTIVASTIVLPVTAVSSLWSSSTPKSYKNVPLSTAAATASTLHQSSLLYSNSTFHHTLYSSAFQKLSTERNAVIRSSNTIPSSIHATMIQIRPTPTFSTTVLMTSRSVTVPPKIKWQSRVFLVGFFLASSTSIDVDDIRNIKEMLNMSLTSIISLAWYDKAIVYDINFHRRTETEVNFQFKIRAINLETVNMAFETLQSQKQMIIIDTGNSQIEASVLSPLDDVIPDPDQPNDKILGLFDWPELLAICIGIGVMLIMLICFIYFCWQARKKRRLGERQNRQQELNTAWGLSRNPSKRAAEWSEWDHVHKEAAPRGQHMDDVWLPVQQDRPRSPYRQFSLYVDEQFPLQERKKPANAAKFPKRKTSNKSNRTSSNDMRNNQQEHSHALDHNESSNNSIIQEEDSNALGWPWKPIKGLTHNKLSASSLNTATDPNDMMKVWHEDGWHQLQDLNTQS